MATPAQRTVTRQDEVLAHVWQTDSRPGLDLLLASLGAPNTEPAEIRFGEGVYDFTRPAVRPAAIDLTDRRNLTLVGAGAGATVLRLMPGQDLSQNTHVIQTLGCRNLTFRDLSVHGAYLGLGNAPAELGELELIRATRCPHGGQDLRGLCFAQRNRRQREHGLIRVQEVVARYFRTRRTRPAAESLIQRSSGRYGALDVQELERVGLDQRLSTLPFWIIRVGARERRFWNCETQSFGGPLDSGPAGSAMPTAGFNTRARKRLAVRRV